jgi:mannose-6-phosphate isomerase
MAAESGAPGPIAPIVLQASLHETIWGGRDLARVAGKTLPDSALVGEAWETALDTVARNAPYTGRTLGALVEELSEALVGARAAAIFGPRFPLLAKFIDARQQLSVQVHPDDRYAAAYEGGKLGKTECWYILEAAPDATVVYGLRERCSPEQVRAAIAGSQLEDLLRTVAVRAGDVLFVPAGTVHAICGGIVLYELQEYSDITYRLYDYGRLQADGRPRALHVDAALAVMRYTPPMFDRVVPVAYGETRHCARRVLVACHYFVLEEARFGGSGESGESLAVEPAPGSCQIVSVLGGACSLRWPEGELWLARGDTAVLPAALGGCELVAVSAQVEPAHIARSYVPQPDDTLMRMWRAAQPLAVEEPAGESRRVP